MLDNFVISNPFSLIFFRSDGTFKNLPYLKKLGIEHVQSQQDRWFNFEWAWSKIFEFSNFDDGILEQVGTVCYLQSNNYKAQRM